MRNKNLIEFIRLVSMLLDGYILMHKTDKKKYGKDTAKEIFRQAWKDLKKFVEKEVK